MATSEFCFVKATPPYLYLAIFVFMPTYWPYAITIFAHETTNFKKHDFISHHDLLELMLNQSSEK